MKTVLCMCVSSPRYLFKICSTPDMPHLLVYQALLTFTDGHNYVRRVQNVLLWRESWLLLRVFHETAQSWTSWRRSENSQKSFAHFSWTCPWFHVRAVLHRRKKLWWTRVSVPTAEYFLLHAMAITALWLMPYLNERLVHAWCIFRDLITRLTSWFNWSCWNTG